MHLYRIANWDKHFENNRSRSVGDLFWVRVPNRHDGENYTSVVTHQDGAKVFSAFILMVEVASKCDPRGVLIRGSGAPHTAVSLSKVTRAPQEWFEIALAHLRANTDWLEYQEVSDEWQMAVSGLPPDWQHAAQEKRRVEKRRKEEEAPPEFCFPLKFGQGFQGEWSKWVKHRMAYGQPKSGWKPMFDKQLTWLDRFEEPTAKEILGRSLRNGWQGLFEIPNGKPKPKKYVPNL